MSFSVRHVAIGVMAGLMAAGCGSAPAAPAHKAPSASKPASTATQPAAQPAQPAQQTQAPPPAKPALKPVSLRLDWILGDYEVPTVFAKAKGYYTNAGMNVTIGEGKGSGSTIQLVANGKADFGLADAATTALFISKGAPVKVIAGFIQQTPDSIMSHKAVGPITSPKQLAGKQIIDTAGSADSHLLAAVLKRYGMTMSDVKMDYVAPADKYALFLKSPKSLILDYYPDDYVKLEQKSPGLYETSYAKFGVNPLSVGLITSDSMIRSHPALVRAFVKATLQGYNAAVQDPNGAVAAGLKAFPNAVVSDAGMKAVLGMFHSKATQGKPIGWMAKSDWQATVDLMHQYGGMKTVKPLADDYTNQFIPAP